MCILRLAAVDNNNKNILYREVISFAKSLFILNPQFRQITSMSKDYKMKQTKIQANHKHRKETKCRSEANTRTKY